MQFAMSVTGVSELLERYDVVEGTLTTAFDACVRDNNLGTILEWQKPLLTKKREMMQYRGVADPAAAPGTATPVQAPAAAQGGAVALEGARRRSSAKKRQNSFFGKMARWGSVDVNASAAAAMNRQDSDVSKTSHKSVKAAGTVAALRNIVSMKGGANDKSPKTPGDAPSAAGGGPAGSHGPSFKIGHNAVSPLPVRAPGDGLAAQPAANAAGAAIGAPPSGQAAPGVAPRPAKAAAAGAGGVAQDDASKGCTVA